MVGAYGRLDYHSRQNVWVIIGYLKGRTPRSVKEVEVGRATTRETASAILQDWYKDLKSRGETYLVQYA